MAKAGIVYVGTDDGLVIFSDPGGTGRWRRVGHALPGQAIRSIYVRSALDLLVATAESGIQQSSDGGQSWQELHANEVTLLTGHPATPETVYSVTTAGSVQRSDDNGLRWQSLFVPENASGPVRLLPAPQDAAHLWLAVGTTIYTSRDRGVTWVVHGTALPAPIASLHASPGHAERLFAVVDGGLFQVHADASVQPLDIAVSETEYTLELAVLAGKPETLLAALATADRTMFMYKDEDATGWQMAQAGDPIEASVTVITPVRYHIDTAWAGTRAGQLLRSSDRGRSWQQIATEPVAIRDLAVVRLI